MFSVNINFEMEVRYMKKALSLLLAAIFVLSLTGCGIKKKIENKIGEAIGEKVLGDKVDLDGDKVTVKGEDGTEVTFGSNEWPKNDIMNDIPKFEKGTVSSVTSSDALVIIYMEGVEKKDFEDYWEKLKDRFSEETLNLQMDDTLSYGGKDKNGIYLQLVYNSSDSTFGLTVSKSE